MATFQKVKLEDVAEVIDSLHITPRYSSVGYPMLRVTDIKPGFLDTKRCLKVNKDVYLEFSKKHKSKKGDIVFSRVGSEGIVSLVAKDEEFCLGQNTAFIIPKEQNNFLYYWLNSPVGKYEIKTKTTGATQRTVSLESIKTLKIYMPSILEQEKIASILFAYDNLIENNEKRIKALEEMAQLLYTEWFVKFKFSGHEKVKMVDSGTEYGAMPEGWEVKRLDDVIQIIRGRSYSSEQISDTTGDYYIVNLKSFNRGGGFRTNGAKYYSGQVSNNQLLKQGDIVVAVTDMTNDRAVIARPARIPNITTHKTTLSADVVKIAADKIPSSFIYYCLLDHRFTEATKHKANGANVLHLKPSAIGEYRALIPSIQLLHYFDALCKPSFDLIDKIMQQNADLEKMRDLLIPQLVTGKRELK